MADTSDYKLTDTDAMSKALDLVMKHAKANNDSELKIKDLPEAVGALMRFSMFLYLAVDKLIEKQESNSSGMGTGLGTTRLRDILAGLYQ